MIEDFKVYTKLLIMFEMKSNDAIKGVMNQFVAANNMVNDPNFTHNETHMSNKNEMKLKF